MLKRWISSTWAYSLYATIAVITIDFTTHHPTSTQVITDTQCDVINVIDGDSLIVQCHQQKHNLRLMHIDAPEITQKHWGTFAKAALIKHTKQSVWVEFHGKDIYQRDLAVIFHPESRQKSINLQLAENGAVRVYSHYNPPKAYINAMRQAKNTQRGIWQEKGLHQDPARYRRLAY